MLISFEGIDGTGKATQALLLKKHYINQGIDVDYFDFPAYDSFIGTEIGKLLTTDSSRGEANALTLPPKVMAMLFALDRMQFFKEITSSLDNNNFVITNRYSLSNCVFQSIRAKKDISDWVDHLEHTALHLPRPDVYIILVGDLEATTKLVGSKGQRVYTDSHDLYEQNAPLLSKAQALYTRITPRGAKKIVVNCMNEGRFRSRDEIHSIILDELRKLELLQR